MLNLKSLEAFVWIVELGGFRKAAEKLNTTQPAISARIAQLEDELKVRLLDRRQGATVPTSKGAELLVYAKRMLDLHNEFLFSIGQVTATSGTVRMGTADVIGASWLEDLVENLAQVYPRLGLEVHFDTSPNLHVALANGLIDIALLDGPVKLPNVENVALDVYTLQWVASPALELQEPVTAEALGPWPVIIFGRTSSAFVGVSELLARADQRAIRVYSAGSLALCVKLVQRGIGIGLLPPAALARELAEGSLRVLPSAEKLALGSFTASYRKGPNARLLAAIASLASSYAGRWKLAHAENGAAP